MVLVDVDDSSLQYQPTVISGDTSLHPPPLHVCISHQINTELRIMYKVSWEGGAAAFAFPCRNTTVCRHTLWLLQETEEPCYSWGSVPLSTSQKAVMPCGCGLKVDMVCVWMTGKTVCPCYTRAISERFRDAA